MLDGKVANCETHAHRFKLSKLEIRSLSFEVAPDGKVANCETARTAVCCKLSAVSSKISSKSEVMLDEKNGKL